MNSIAQRPGTRLSAAQAQQDIATAQHRISEGLKSGKLTKKEAAAMQAELAKIQAQLKNDGFDKGGLNDGESAKLTESLAKMNQALSAELSNDQNRFSKRLESAKTHLNQGVADGSLTREEAAPLLKQLEELTNKTTGAKWGGLSEPEKTALNTQFNALDQKVHETRRDGVNDLEKRYKNFEDRIAAGLGDGSLTPKEAQKLRTDMLVMRQKIGGAELDGLQPEERAPLAAALNKMTDDIYSARHNKTVDIPKMSENLSSRLANLAQNKMLPRAAIDELKAELANIHQGCHLATATPQQKELYGARLNALNEKVNALLAGLEPAPKDEDDTAPGSDSRPRRTDVPERPMPGEDAASRGCWTPNRSRLDNLEARIDAGSKDKTLTKEEEAGLRTELEDCETRLTGPLWGDEHDKTVAERQGKIDKAEALAGTICAEKGRVEYTAPTWEVKDGAKAGGLPKEIQLDNGYKLSLEGENMAWSVTGPDGTTSRIWGDPHVAEGDGGAWDFMQDGTFLLDDGTKVSVGVKQWGGNPNVTVSDSLTITRGNQALTVTGIATNDPTQIKISGPNLDGVALDKATNDGYVFRQVGGTSDDWKLDDQEKEINAGAGVNVTSGAKTNEKTNVSMGGKTPMGKELRAFLDENKLDYPGKATAGGKQVMLGKEEWDIVQQSLHDFSDTLHQENADDEVAQKECLGHLDTLDDHIWDARHNEDPDVGVKLRTFGKGAKASTEADIAKAVTNGQLTETEAKEAYKQLGTLMSKEQKLASDGGLSRKDKRALQTSYDTLQNKIEELKTNETVDTQAGLDSLFQKLEGGFKSGQLTGDPVDADGEPQLDAAGNEVKGEYSKLKQQWSDLKARADDGEDIGKDLSALVRRTDRKLSNTSVDLGQQQKFYANSIQQGLDSGLLTDQEGRRLKSDLATILDASGKPVSQKTEDGLERTPTPSEVKDRLAEFSKSLGREKGDAHLNTTKRFANFDARLKEGKESGQLTAKEFADLQKRSGTLHKQVDTLQAEIASGELDPAQVRAKREQIKRLTDDFSTHLYNQKHNAATNLTQRIENLAGQVIEAVFAQKIDWNQFGGIAEKLIKLASDAKDKKNLKPAEQKWLNDQLNLLAQSTGVNVAMGPSMSSDVG
jgi:hypothetical protein